MVANIVTGLIMHVVSTIWNPDLQPKTIVGLLWAWKQFSLYKDLNKDVYKINLTPQKCCAWPNIISFSYLKYIFQIIFCRKLCHQKKIPQKDIQRIGMLIIIFNYLYN